MISMGFASRWSSRLFPIRLNIRQNWALLMWESRVMPWMLGQPDPERSFRLTILAVLI